MSFRRVIFQHHGQLWFLGVLQSRVCSTLAFLYWSLCRHIKVSLFSFSGPNGDESKQPAYPGFERDVLRTVADYFQRLKEPLLTFHLYEVFVNILSECFSTWIHYSVSAPLFGGVQFVNLHVSLSESRTLLFSCLQVCCQCRRQPLRPCKSAASCCHLPTEDASSFCCVSWPGFARIPSCLHLMTRLLPAHWYV